jgi:hypothetical protein
MCDNYLNQETTLENFISVGYKKMSALFNESNIHDKSDWKTNEIVPKQVVQADIDKQKIKDNKNKLRCKYKLNVDYSDKDLYPNKTDLNSLLFSENLIPDYKCCTQNVGQTVNLNMCDLTNFLPSKPKLYQLEDHHNNTYYITNPMGVSENIASDIFGKISPDNLTSYIKK